MDALLRDRLSARFVSRLCPDTVEVRRLTMTDDGRGGNTLSWRTICTQKGRMSVGAGDESQPGGGIEVTGRWRLLIHRSVDVRAQDRIYVPGNTTQYWEVVGSDIGTTDLLIQHIDLEERAQ